MFDFPTRVRQAVSEMNRTARDTDEAVARPILRRLLDAGVPERLRAGDPDALDDVWSAIREMQAYQ